MTPKQFADSLRKKIDELQRLNRPFQIAVLDSVARVSKRAFSDAQNEKGESFRYNDIEPLYVSDEQSPRKLSHKGKNGRSVFASTGEKHKTTYFQNYKEFRRTVLREDNFVNWQLTGDLMSDYGSLSPPTSKKPPSLAKLKPAVKINPNNYITKLDREINIKKYEGLSDRYGNFLECSEKEEKEFYRVLEGELALFLSR